MKKEMPVTIFLGHVTSSVRMEGDTFIIRMREDNELKKIPAINVEALVFFGKVYATSGVLGYCARRGIMVSYFSVNGRFLFKLDRSVVGSNILLRRAQHEATKPENALETAKKIVIAKIFYQRQALNRYKRDYGEADENLKYDIDRLRRMVKTVEFASDLDRLRGYEGQASKLYFDHFDKRILKNKEDFYFHKRSRRPPMDRVNAMLSLGYNLLAKDMTGVLESVGLDPAMGFLHSDRPGRMSLALDLLESFRVVVVDRLVLKLINTRQIQGNDFEISASGSVRMKDKSRKIFMDAYSAVKREEHMHDYVKEKMMMQEIWHLQARLLARYLRGEEDDYTGFAIK